MGPVTVPTIHPSPLYHASPVRNKRTKAARKPMLFIDRTGRVCYRTRLIRSASVATRFARLLFANSRFSEPEVVQSRQCKGEGWFVTYRPSNPTRQEALIERLQAERIARCQSEMASYRWSEGERAGFLYCRSKSGSEYHVSATTCSCVDYNETCRDLGLLCKHSLAYNLREGDPFAETDDDDAFAGVQIAGIDA